MHPQSSDYLIVLGLRRDAALQLSRHIRSLNVTQVVAAKLLGLPQPTLSKILNDRVSDLSLELLLRAAYRAGLQLILQIGRVPGEAGAYVSGSSSPAERAFRSYLGEQARIARLQSTLALDPTQRLEAFLEHNQLMASWNEAAHTVRSESLSSKCEKP